MDTVGRNTTAIKEYIKNQIQEDIVADQISLKEYVDPHYFRLRENEPSARPYLRVSIYG